MSKYDFLMGSGGFCGSGRFSVEIWVVWWISGGFLVGFSWVLWFWAVFGGILGGLVDFWWISCWVLVGFVFLGGFW